MEPKEERDRWRGTGEGPGERDRQIDWGDRRGEKEEGWEGRGRGGGEGRWRGSEEVEREVARGLGDGGGLG